MKAILKNLITLKARWIPNDPVETFTPYLVHIIREKKLYATQVEDIASAFESYYGFKATSFLIKNVLSHLIDKNVCKKKGNLFHFTVSKLKQLDTIKEEELERYVGDVNDLVNDFLHYCDDDSITFNDAESIIIDFIKEYDSDLLFTEKGIINRDDNPALKFFWIEYLKGKIKLNTGEYRTVLKMCEGNIIKSLMFDEVESNNIYPDMKVFIDTPIIFRLLGYYGTYMQLEYEFLFESWKKQGGNFYIYEHNLNECISILRTSEDWVEEKEIDLARTSDVCIFFRELGYVKEDVALEIETFEKKLRENNIIKYSVDFNENSGFMEDSKQIRDMILRQYNRRATFDSTDHTNTMIDIDAKSILYSYYLRENNEIHSMREAKVMYLTSNSGLFIVANNYQKSKYGQSISPVQLDTFIGMVICSNDSNNITKVTENRIISHCYSAYKPSRALKETYNEKLIEMLTKKEINNEDYYLLKHHSIITKELVKGTCGVAENLSNETIYDFLKVVKIRLVDEERALHRKKLNESNELHKEYKKEIEDKYKKDIAIKDEKINDIVGEKKILFVKLVNNDFHKFVGAIKNIYFIALTTLTCYLSFFAIKSIVLGETSIPFMISSIVMVIFTFGQILFYSYKVTNVFEKVFSFKLKYYENKYKEVLVTEDDLK